MPQSLSSIFVHIIFSTKCRKPFIHSTMIHNLHKYMVGIAREHNAYVHEIGGVEDHVHLLVSLPRTISLCKLVEEIKKGSSRWMKTQGKDWSRFAWQNGYGAFSIGRSSYENLRRYIQNQQEHHKKISFQDEYRAFLRKYGVEFDERYVWD